MLGMLQELPGKQSAAVRQFALNWQMRLAEMGPLVAGFTEGALEGPLEGSREGLTVDATGNLLEGTADGLEEGLQEDGRRVGLAEGR